MSQQHWQKEIKFENMRFKLKKLSPFEFPAFKTSFAKATNDNDPEGIAKSYEMMTSWVLVNLMEAWVPVYDKSSKSFTIDSLNDPYLANNLIDLVLTDLIMPLFMNSTE
jgi:hypothetical protein